MPKKNKSSKNMVEVCAKCGTISSQSDSFKCQSCDCEVCVVLPIKLFETMIQAGWAKKKDAK